jgi:hypothetical protein
MHLGQEHRARSEVVAADLRGGEGLGVADVGVADDRQMIAKRLERLEAGSAQVEVASDTGRRPQVFLDAIRRAAGGAVDHLDADEPDLLSGRRAEGLADRRHRLEQRQPHRHADPFEDGAARQVFLRHEHRVISSLTLRT